MLLDARRLSIAYGDAPAVWDATLQVDAGITPDYKPDAIRRGPVPSRDVGIG